MGRISEPEKRAQNGPFGARVKCILSVSTSAQHKPTRTLLDGDFGGDRLAVSQQEYESKNFSSFASTCRHKSNNYVSYSHTLLNQLRHKISLLNPADQAPCHHSEREQI